MGELIDLYDQAYKWLVYRFDKDAENPYGTSVLKSCYWPWKFKKAGAQFWLMAAEKFSVPSILALFDSSEPEERLRERALRLSELLSTVQSGSGAALANIKDVKLLSTPEKVSEFKTLMEWCDTQIAYGIVYQSLAVQEAEYGTRAQAEVHKDILSSVARAECLELSEVFQRLVDWIVELNFGTQVVSPRIQFDFREPASWQQLVEAVDRNIPVSKSAIYERYGIPEPVNAEDEFIKPSTNPLSAIELADTGTGKKKARFPLL
jgi:phage gp29-like protein